MSELPLYRGAVTLSGGARFAWVELSVGRGVHGAGAECSCRWGSESDPGDRQDPVDRQYPAEREWVWQVAVDTLSLPGASIIVYNNWPRVPTGTPGFIAKYCQIQDPYKEGGVPMKVCLQPRFFAW